jgi:hypothetical protein
LVGLGDHLGPVIANGDRAPMGSTVFTHLTNLKRSGDLLELTPTIFGGALALAIIASIDALLCTKLVMAAGEARRDGNRVLRQLGIANLAAGCFGGITGGINIGASVTNRTFGARSSLSVLINAAALLVASVFFFRWLGGIPRAALSAVIMVIAVQHFDLWSLRLMSRVRGAPRAVRVSTAIDLLVVIVVAIVSITLNIVLAVFIGVAIAAIAVRLPHEPLGRAAKLSLRHQPVAQIAHDVRTRLSRARRRRDLGDGIGGSPVLRHWRNAGHRHRCGRGAGGALGRSRPAPPDRNRQQPTFWWS